MTIVVRGPGVIACSFTDSHGSGMVGNREYFWDFSEQFGPLFTDRHGREYKRQPGIRTHAWIAFERWHARRQAFKEMNTSDTGAKHGG